MQARPAITRTLVLAVATALLGPLGACAQHPSPVPTVPASQSRTPAAHAPAHAHSGAARFDLDQLVQAFLHLQYPKGYDDRNDCWRTSYGKGDDAMSYCMHALPAHLVTEKGQRVLYVAAGSVADIEGDPDYRYSATDPGMFDAYRLAVEPDGHTRQTSAARGVDYGSGGDCGCMDADFVQLGPDVHGWVFSSGGTWQGETTLTQAVVAPTGAQFRDIAGIPQRADGDADAEYRIALTKGPPSAGLYPLKVLKYRNGQKVSEHLISFDAAAGRYVVPKEF